jgi:hypothetical protein
VRNRVMVITSLGPIHNCEHYSTPIYESTTYADGSMFGFGALFGMCTEEVANLTWERILFDIERIILALKGIHTLTLAGGFDKSHQQSLMKHTARR